MRSSLLRLRRRIDGRKWILWVMLAAVVVIGWFVLVALLPHHVLNTLQGYEEQANGLRGAGHTVRESP